MDKFNSFKDLKEHFANFKLVIDEHNGINRAKQGLEYIVDKLTQEIEVLQKSQQSLQKQLQAITCASESETGVNTLYVNLKEKYNGLQGKVDVLLKEAALQQERHRTEVAELEEKFRQEKNIIFEDLNRQLDEQRNGFLRKEQELSNELQLAQASNALQCDELETIQSQLKNWYQSCNALHEEYLTFKMHSNYDADIANKHIQELERKLQLTEQQLGITQEQLFNATKNKNFEILPNKDATMKLNQPQMRPTHPTFVNTNKSTTAYDKNRSDVDDNTHYSTATISTRPTKYASLNVNAVTPASNINQNTYAVESLQGAHPEHLSAHKEAPENFQHGASNLKKVASSNFKSFLPALKQLSKPGQKAYPRKRKLHNPGSLDYLNDMESPD